MNKRHILKNLELAKPDHMEWIKQGHKLMQGEPQEKLKKPVKCTCCGFGRWYYKEGFKLVNIPQLKELEELHDQIHQTYTALYYITYDRRQKPRSTILSGGVEVPIKEKVFRQKKLEQLEKKTLKMVRMIGNIEKKVNTMQTNDFESIWFQ